MTLGKCSETFKKRQKEGNDNQCKILSSEEICISETIPVCKPRESSATMRARIVEDMCGGGLPQKVMANTRDSEIMEHYYSSERYVIQI